MSTVYLSLGSNEGDRLRALSDACESISGQAGVITAVSPVYESEPWGFKAETYFLNQVLKLETRLDPQQLIKVLLNIEALLGRKRLPGPYQSRIIDIDILLFGRNIIDAGDLIIPHPRLHRRRFILEPLAQLDAELVHPVLGVTVKELLEQCDDQGSVVIVAGKA